MELEECPVYQEGLVSREFLEVEAFRVQRVKTALTGKLVMVLRAWRVCLVFLEDLDVLDQVVISEWKVLRAFLEMAQQLKGKGAVQALRVLGVKLECQGDLVFLVPRDSKDLREKTVDSVHRLLMEKRETLVTPDSLASLVSLDPLDSWASMALKVSLANLGWRAYLDDRVFQAEMVSLVSLV